MPLDAADRLLLRILQVDDRYGPELLEDRELELADTLAQRGDVHVRGVTKAHRKGWTTLWYAYPTLKTAENREILLERLEREAVEEAAARR